MLFLKGLVRFLFLPIYLLITFILIVIDIIYMLGGKSWLFLDEHYYVKFSKFYFGDKND